MDLVITQLTDIHIKYESDLDILLQRTGSIVGAIFEVIRNVKETILLICVTGDIAFSGTEEQYVLARRHLSRIFSPIKSNIKKLIPLCCCSGKNSSTKGIKMLREPKIRFSNCPPLRQRPCSL